MRQRHDSVFVGPIRVGRAWHQRTLGEFSEIWRDAVFGARRHLRCLVRKYHVINSGGVGGNAGVGVDLVVVVVVLVLILVVVVVLLVLILVVVLVLFIGLGQA